MRSATSVTAEQPVLAVKLLTAFGVALTLLYLALDRLDSTFAPLLFVAMVVVVFLHARFRRRQAGGRYS